MCGPVFQCYIIVILKTVGWQVGFDLSTLAWVQHTGKFPLFNLPIMARDMKGNNNGVMIRETWIFPDMRHWVKLTHLWTEQHEIMVRRSNNSTFCIASLESRGYSPIGFNEKSRLSFHPLCWSSVHAGRSFKGQLKSPPMIIGPVHVLAAVKLVLKFIGSLLVKTWNGILEGRGVSIDRNTKDFQWLSLNSAHGNSGFIAIDPLLLTDVICPQWKARDHSNSTWGR